MEKGLDRNSVINELSRSCHGKLEEYRPVISEASAKDPEFVAHLIAFDRVNGQIRDSKQAIPVITLHSAKFPDELVENSLAHLMLLSPRELLKALRFSIQEKTVNRRQKLFENTIRRYLIFRHQQPQKWMRLAATFRRPMRDLYALTNCPMPEWASVLFGCIREERQDGVIVRTPTSYPKGSILADIANLKGMTPEGAAAAIQKWHLSPLVVSGAMTGSKAQEDVRVVQATMEQMSDTQTINAASSLKRKGITKDASLKETYRKKAAKAAQSGRVTLKTSVKAEAADDDWTKDILKQVQERQIQAQKESGRGIEGDWLVIVDKSSSQDVAIRLGADIGAAIGKFVSGKVWLVFCDNTAYGFEVTGMTLEKIRDKTKLIIATGGTSYGVGLEWASSKGISVDGVVIIGDGGENQPPFFSIEYQRFAQKAGKPVPVYLYRTYCDSRYANSINGNPQQFRRFMESAKLAFTEFDLTHGNVDYYSLSNLVQTMQANRFGVIEKVMASPLLSLAEVMPEMATTTR